MLRNCDKRQSAHTNHYYFQIFNLTGFYEAKAKTTQKEPLKNKLEQMSTRWIPTNNIKPLKQNDNTASNYKKTSNGPNIFITLIFQCVYPEAIFFGAGEILSPHLPRVNGLGG